MTCAPMTPTPTSDTDLAARFAREVEPYIEVLARAAGRRTLRRADADDLLQDTLLRAFAGFQTFQPGTNLRAWLFRIMHNQWISGHRAKQARIQEVWIGAGADHESVSEPQRQSGGARSAEAEFLESIPDATVREALAALPDGFAEVVFYADVEGYTLAETASILDIPAGTVMSRIHRARRRLRLALAALSPCDAATAERISA